MIWKLRYRGPIETRGLMEMMEYCLKSCDHMGLSHSIDPPFMGKTFLTGHDPCAIGPAIEMEGLKCYSNTM